MPRKIDAHVAISPLHYQMGAIQIIVMSMSEDGIVYVPDSGRSVKFPAKIDWYECTWNTYILHIRRFQHDKYY